MQEMRGDRLQRAVAESDRLAAVGQRHDPVVGVDAMADRQVVGRQVRQEARPQLGADHPGAGVQQPLVEGGDDVRVLVRSEDVVQLLQRKAFRQFQRERRVGQVAAGIEQQVLAVVDDQELVGLDPFAADEVIETQALVAAVVEQHDRFASHGR